MTKILAAMALISVLAIPAFAQDSSKGKMDAKIPAHHMKMAGKKHHKKHKHHKHSKHKGMMAPKMGKMEHKDSKMGHKKMGHKMDHKMDKKDDGKM